ncbi:membrane protease subunit (stomatin/prohibitin family) [Nocardiopsis sp. Huas11]|uniref:SPFH domain-containing protein n=1 Tax=Nocardiopsis sp. Huas11 TaxID=2183912 RepID=UPI000EAB9447|nr:SPFH domain-containing protein [Nocardiopsis sp. Huas11]RKS08994.1 membrane protease subunit (stomatin/prohibitin family) [Nocardiopsis sp. Huas11]
MGLLDSLRGELVDIIEWTDDTRDTMVWRFPRHDNEIKMGAQLIVRESQAAVFVNEGRLADVFTPGTYTLETRNVPILSTLKGWKHGFDSPFKAEVYFVNVRLFSDFKWGTKNPVMVRDPEFGPVRLRAFGGFAARVVDPAKFVGELVGTDPMFRTEEVEGYLRQMIVSRLGSALGTAARDIPVLDMAAEQHEMGQRLAAVLSEDMASVGLRIDQFNVESITLPPEVEKALDKRTQMGMVGDLDAYSKFQTANAVETAAGTPGSGMSDALGMGMGLAAAQQMAQNANPQQPAAQSQQPAQAAQPQAPAGPPPLPQQVQWFVGASGQQQGPFGADVLAQRAGSGQLTRDTLVWREGMEQWTPAGQVSELSGLFAATPPPMPPS